MTTFSIPTRDQVSENNQLLFDSLNKLLGFVPNLYAIIAYSENALGKYLAFQGGKTSLSNKEKEAVNLVVSQLNDCRYCQAAHTVLGKMNGFTAEQTLDLRAGESTDSKLNALVSLTKEITLNKGKVGQDSLNRFFNEGYSKASLVDLIMQISDKIAMNYLHNLTNIPIDFPAAPALPAKLTE